LALGRLRPSRLPTAAAGDGALAGLAAVTGLLLVGDGPEGPSLQALAAELDWDGCSSRAIEMSGAGAREMMLFRHERGMSNHCRGLAAGVAAVAAMPAQWRDHRAVSGCVRPRMSRHLAAQLGRLISDPGLRGKLARARPPG